MGEFTQPQHNDAGTGENCNIGNRCMSLLARAAALQLVAVRRSTGNDVSEPLFSPLSIGL